jgi:uncharacterized membrane protein
MSKQWYLSKTLWANALAALALFIQSEYGYVIPVEVQMQILAAVNIALRFLTKTELVATPTV